MLKLPVKWNWNKIKETAPTKIKVLDLNLSLTLNDVKLGARKRGTVVVLPYLTTQHFNLLTPT